MKSRHGHKGDGKEQREEEFYQEQQQTYIPSQQYPQEQQIYTPSQLYPQEQLPTTGPVFTAPQPTTPTTTSLVYPPQANMRTVGYIQSTIPPHIMFKSQQPLQIPAQQISNNPMLQSSPYTDPPPIQTPTYQMAPPSTYHYPQQQQQQQLILNSPYGYTQH